MKAHQSHIIRRQMMDVEIPSRKGAFELQQELGRWVQLHLKPVLEEVFDELVPENQVIRLDKIEIDLGALSSGNFKEKISSSLKEQLKFAIKKQLTQQTELLSPQMRLPRNVIAQQAIDLFLQNGYLPWWTPGPSLSLLLAEISSNIHPTWAQSCFQLAVREKYVLKRLLRQFTDDFIFELAEAAYSRFPARKVFEELRELSFFHKPGSAFSSSIESLLFWQASAPLLSGSVSLNQDLETFFENWIQLQFSQRKSELATGLLFHASKFALENNDTTKKGNKAFPLISSLFSKEKPSLIFNVQFWKMVKEQIELSPEDETMRSEGYPSQNTRPELLPEGSLSDTVYPHEEGHSSVSAGFPHPSKPETSAEKESSLLPSPKEKSEKEKSEKDQETELPIDQSGLQETHEKSPLTPEKQPQIKESSHTTSSSFREASEALLAKLYQKFRANQQAEKRKIPFSKSELPEEGVYVTLAGVVLLHPFLPPYLLDQKLLLDNQFVDEKAREEAVYHLAFLATGQTQWEEHQLLIPKLLCGIPFEQALEAEFELSQAAKTEANNLLSAVIKHWGALGKASPDGLREGFLIREGRLCHTDDNGWMLKVEQRTMDILMGKLPWGLGYVKLPWLTELIRVEWS